MNYHVIIQIKSISRKLYFIMFNKLSSMLQTILQQYLPNNTKLFTPQKLNYPVIFNINVLMKKKKVSDILRYCLAKLKGKIKSFNRSING